MKELQDKLAHEEVRQGVDVASFFRTECSPLEGVCVPCRRVVWCVQSSRKSASVEAEKKIAKFRVCGCVLQRCSEAAFIDPSVVALLRTCDCS